MFNQLFLPLMKTTTGKDGSEQEAREFVEQFGSYLELHSCFLRAVAMQSMPMIDVLLDIANHDPRHREVMKMTSKPGALVLYEQVCNVDALSLHDFFSSLAHFIILEHAFWSTRKTANAPLGGGGRVTTGYN